MIKNIKLNIKFLSYVQIVNDDTLLNGHPLDATRHKNKFKIIYFLSQFFIKIIKFYKIYLLMRVRTSPGKNKFKIIYFSSQFFIKIIKFYKIYLLDTENFLKFIFFGKDCDKKWNSCKKFSACHASCVLFAILVVPWTKVLPGRDTFWENDIFSQKSDKTVSKKGPGNLAFWGLFSRIWHFLGKCQKVVKKGQKGTKLDPPEFAKNRQKSSKNTKNRVFFAKNRCRFWRASATSPV